MSGNTFKYTNYTKEEIKEYLDIVKNSIRKGNFTICTTEKNEKNRNFIAKYKLDSNKQKQMLIELEVNDFCYTADNYNNPEEMLYIFCREYELNNWGKIEIVKVYIKIAIKKENFVVIVSFHKPEKNVEKLFL